MNNHSSGTLHTLTDSPLKIGSHGIKAHDAVFDSMSMGRYLDHMHKTGKLTDLSQLPTNIPIVDPRSQNVPKAPAI